MTTLLQVKTNIAVDYLTKSLEEAPHTWKYTSDSHTRIKKLDANIELVVDFNSCYLSEPYEVKFGYFQMRRLRKAYRCWRDSWGKDQIAENQTKALSYVINRLNPLASTMKRRAGNGG